MISLQLAGEPQSFDARVRKPGAKFLVQSPQPTSPQWAVHNYWIRAKQDLYRAYRGICAYTCHLIHPDTGSDTVEHFAPKSIYPKFAYEWNNLRLVCGRLNGRKGAHQDVIDPFKVKPGMFTLGFPSLLILPGINLKPSQLKVVESTIRRLGLNDEICIDGRLHYVKPYCQGHIDFEYLSECAPFIALELQRQGLVNSITQMMVF